MCDRGCQNKYLFIRYLRYPLYEFVGGLARSVDGGQLNSAILRLEIYVRSRGRSCGTVSDSQIIGFYMSVRGTCFQIDATDDYRLYEASGGVYVSKWGCVLFMTGLCY